MLKLILGRAGSGKIHQMMREICALAEKGQRSIVLVPEQYSVEKEREIISSLGNELSWEIEVLNFERLCDVVFRNAGGGAADTIDQGGRMLVMARALDAVRPNLRVYQDAAEKPEFILHLLRIFDEFVQYKVHTEELLSASGEQGELAEKSHDLTLICEAYRSLLGGELADPLEQSARAVDRLREKDVFGDYHVFVEAFSVFSPVQYEWLEGLVKQAKQVTVALCCDHLNYGSAVFETTRKTAAILRKLADQNGIACEVSVCERKEEKIPKGLIAAERMLYEYGKVNEQFKSDGLRLIAAADPYDEIEFVAREVRRLIREEGYRFRDVSVICRQKENYLTPVTAVFERLAIPYFIDKSSDTLQKPIAAAVFSLMSIWLKGYQYEDLFMLLKTGLAFFQHAEIDLLENYAYSWQLSGKKTWEKPFSRHPDGYHKQLDDAAREKLHLLEDLRKRLIEPLKEAEQKFMKGTAAEKAAAICEVLVTAEVPAHLNEDTEELRNRGFEVLATENEQLWDNVMTALSQMALFCEEKIESARFAELFKLTLSAYTVGAIPTALDQVIVGSVDRLRTGHVKITFVVGFNEGEFPRNKFDEGLLIDRDREELHAKGIRLSPGTRELALEERFYAYSALCSPSDVLYLCYTASDLKGGEQRPSYLLGILRRIVPDLKPEYPALTESPIMQIESSEEALGFLAAARAKHEENAFTHALRQYLKQTPAGKRLKAIEEAALLPEDEKLGSNELTQKLYGGKAISPTSLERYIKCRFSYFCDYGLQAKKRKKNEFDALETGTFMHFVLENYARKLMQQDGNFNLSKEEQKKLVDEIVGEYLKEALPDFEELPARFRFLFNRLKEVLLHFIEQLTYELKTSKFTPRDFELEIGKAISPLVIDNGSNKVRIRGKIDRVDTYEKDGKTYFRIVDYKTGNKKFSYSEIYQGLGLQLILYLFALWENGEEYLKGKPIPAGALYAPVLDDTLSVADRNLSEEEIEALRRDKISGRGLVLGEEEILEALDETGDFPFLPVVLQKNGEVDYAKSHFYDLSKLGRLRVYAEKLLFRVKEELEEGEIAVNPFKGEVDSCAFCDMLPICRFEEKRSKARAYPKMRKEEFWKAIEEVEEHE